MPGVTHSRTGARTYRAAEGRPAALDRAVRRPRIAWAACVALRPAARCSGPGALRGPSSSRSAEPELGPGRGPGPMPVCRGARRHRSQRAGAVARRTAASPAVPAFALCRPQPVHVWTTYRPHSREARRPGWGAEVVLVVRHHARRRVRLRRRGGARLRGTGSARSARSDWRPGGSGPRLRLVSIAAVPFPAADPPRSARPVDTYRMLRTKVGEWQWVFVISRGEKKIQQRRAAAAGLRGIARCSSEG